MDELLAKLDGHMDEASKTMVRHLLEKKIKYDQYKRKHVTLLCFLMVYACSVFLIIYTSIIVPHQFSVIRGIAALFDETFKLFLVVITVFLYGGVDIYNKRKTKAESEYQALRKEFIEKAPELWDESHWESRHIFFKAIKAEYDINLYHESK